MVTLEAQTAQTAGLWAVEVGGHRTKRAAGAAERRRAVSVVALGLSLGAAVDPRVGQAAIRWTGPTVCHGFLRQPGAGCVSRDASCAGQDASLPVHRRRTTTVRQAGARAHRGTPSGTGRLFGRTCHSVTIFFAYPFVGGAYVVSTECLAAVVPIPRPRCHCTSPPRWARVQG